jgi:hypothetical protein
LALLTALSYVALLVLPTPGWYPTLHPLWLIASRKTALAEATDAALVDSADALVEFRVSLADMM